MAGWINMNIEQPMMSAPQWYLVTITCEDKHWCHYGTVCMHRDRHIDGMFPAISKRLRTLILWRFTKFLLPADIFCKKKTATA